ncbi:MAG: HD domain-containing phosphohydrolase [Leptolinea sp.]
MSIPLRVLIVEDTPADADLLVMRLNMEDYQLDWQRVENEEDFLAALENPYDLILSDWTLPQFSGIRAFELVVERGLEIPFIIVSGGIGEETAVAVMRQGAADYLLKDRLERLGQAVHNALDQKKMRVEHKRAEEMLRLQATALNAAANAIVITDSNGSIEWANPAFTNLTGYAAAEAIGKNPRDLLKSGKHETVFYKHMWDTILAGNVWRGEMFNRRKDNTLYTEDMTITPIRGSDGNIRRFIAIKQDISERKQSEAALQKSSEELLSAYSATLQGWSNALELREHETAGHSQRVVKTTLKLARLMGIKEEEMVHIQRGALLHDIGKMGIPDSILLKPGPLSDDEWVIMRQHPQYAYRLLSIIPFLEPALNIPYCHHEKWDGTGYPRRLKGEEIPLAARLFAIVDVFDALTADRPYRPAWTEESTIQFIQGQRDKHFDPQVVDAFLTLVNNKE